ncbi:MAG: hypothetical protein WC045_01500 [Patescibacteria group bacterium]
MSSWIILERDGSVMDATTLPERPDDSRQMQSGNQFTPWYKEDEHVHVEDGKINGIHFNGPEEDARAILSLCIKHEKELLERFGGHEDILLIDALKFLVIHTL